MSSDPSSSPPDAPPHASPDAAPPTAAKNAGKAAGKKPAARRPQGKSPRRRSREFALQGLYEWLLSGSEAGVIDAHMREQEGFD